MTHRKTYNKEEIKKSFQNVKHCNAKKQTFLQSETRAIETIVFEIINIEKYVSTIRFSL